MDSVTLSLSYGKDKQIGRDRRKIVKRDGDRLDKLSQLRRHAIDILFTPNDLDILKGGPSERRNFLDQLLVYFDDNYLSTLKNYEETRRQRNSLLKQPSIDELLMDQYDETLIQTGKQLITTRDRFLPNVEEQFKEKAALLMGLGGNRISLRYDPDVERKNYDRVLMNTRPEDRERGYTTRGPHRDDWTMEIGGRPVDRFASQGELRTLVLALKISANSVIINCLSRCPIMLFDDLESELDDVRKKRVLSLLDSSPSQVIITGRGGLESSVLGESSDRMITLERG